jgi:nucleoside-diphosphate-sugar epimerase
LRHGYEVIFIARGANAKSAERRITDALSFVDPESVRFRDNYRVFEGDVCEPLCGLRASDLAQLKRREISRVWHVAASVAFAQKNAAETRRTNVGGTRNILALSAMLQPEQFLMTSTAFVCGDYSSNGVVYESDLDMGQRFYNPYESTKREGERLVRTWAEANPQVQTLVFRPGILAGDSETGKTWGFSGYYTYMRTYFVLRNWLQAQDRKDLVEWRDGAVVLPIEVPGIYDSPLNIVTIDYVVWSMFALSERGLPGTYNLTPDLPASYGFWLDEGTRCLGFRDVRVGAGSAADGLLARVQKQIRSGIADYVPYVSFEPLFDKTNVKQALGSEYRAHPPPTRRLVETLLGYAVQNGFRQ